MGNENKNLFWYGVGANLKKGVGKVLLVIGIFAGLGGLVTESVFGAFIGLALLVLGIYMMASGSSQRFDYKQRSGSMIHRGDW